MSFKNGTTVEKVNTWQDTSLYYSLERAYWLSLHAVWVEQRDGHCIFFLSDETDEMQGNPWAWQGKAKSLELLISYWGPLQQPMAGERGVTSQEKKMTVHIMLSAWSIESEGPNVWPQNAAVSNSLFFMSRALHFEFLSLPQLRSLSKGYNFPKDSQGGGGCQWQSKGSWSGGGGCYFHFLTITLPFFEINGHFLQSYVKWYQIRLQSMPSTPSLWIFLCRNSGAAVNWPRGRARRLGQATDLPCLQEFCQEAPSSPEQILSQWPVVLELTSKLSCGQKGRWGAAALETSTARTQS